MSSGLVRHKRLTHLWHCVPVNQQSLSHETLLYGQWQRTQVMWDHIYMVHIETNLFTISVISTSVKAQSHNMTPWLMDVPVRRDDYFRTAVSVAYELSCLCLSLQLLGINCLQKNSLDPLQYMLKNSKIMVLIRFTKGNCNKCLTFNVHFPSLQLKWSQPCQTGYNADTMFKPTLNSIQ